MWLPCPKRKKESERERVYISVENQRLVFIDVFMSGWSEYPEWKINEVVLQDMLQDLLVMIYIKVPLIDIIQHIS